MDKILKAADDIAAVFNITREWLDPKRSAVVKILKELVKENRMITPKCPYDSLPMRQVWVCDGEDCPNNVSE